MEAQSNSWMDDFNEWSTSDTCCKYWKDTKRFCPHNADGATNGCAPCNFDVMNMTKDDYFERYFSYFLNDNPDAFCAKAGHPSYAAVRI